VAEVYVMLYNIVIILCDRIGHGRFREAAVRSKFIKEVTATYQRPELPEETCRPTRHTWGRRQR